MENKNYSLLQCFIDDCVNQKIDVLLELSSLNDIIIAAKKYMKLKEKNYIFENFFCSTLLFLILRSTIKVDKSSSLLISSGIGLISLGLESFEKYTLMNRIQWDNPTVDFENFSYEEIYNKKRNLCNKILLLNGLIDDCIDELKLLQENNLKKGNFGRKNK